MENTMKPLKTNLLVLTWPNASPPNESTSKWEKIARPIFMACVIITHFFGAMSGAFFIHKFLSTRLEESILAVVNTIAFSYGMYYSILIIFLRHKLIAIIENLSKIYDESKSKLLIFVHS